MNLVELEGEEEVLLEPTYDNEEEDVDIYPVGESLVVLGVI